MKAVGVHLHVSLLPQQRMNTFLCVLATFACDFSERYIFMKVPTTQGFGLNSEKQQQKKVSVSFTAIKTFEFDHFHPKKSEVKVLV